MIDPERRVLLKHYLEAGAPVRVLAWRLQIMRRPIQRWVAAGQTDGDVDISEIPYTTRPERRNSSMPMSRFSRSG